VKKKKKENGAQTTDCGSGVDKAEAKAGTVGYEKGNNEVDKFAEEQHRT